VAHHPLAHKFIICPGVCHVVHPGTAPPVIYTKSKADILIASLTADQHITKGVYRPHVPQDLRALNLAAFEMVDYVLIDERDKPLENIRLIEPDYFAKGFEYGGNGLSAETAEELAVVQSYGGELIFTPGDIVYSSSALIRQDEPDVRHANLQILMERNSIDFDMLRGVLNEMRGHRVHVVGDTIVDSYTYC